jgi:electron transport complex protein RnfG
MAKIESSFRNMLLSLTLISLAASTALGLVYELTKGPIEATLLAKKIESIKMVLPGFDNNPNNEMFKLPDGTGDSLEIYPARKGDKIIGYAVRTSSDNGFSGHIGIMAGFLPDGTINNITVLEQKETPGLGNKMTEPQFKNQFNGKNPAAFTLKVKKDGGQVDAITAATISSRAFCEAVQRAYNTLRKGGIE